MEAKMSSSRKQNIKIESSQHWDKYKNCPSNTPQFVHVWNPQMGPTRKKKENIRKLKNCVQNVTTDCDKETKKVTLLVCRHQDGP